MAINKVEANGETLIDLTEDTVTPETLARGVTAHDASGEQIVGTRSLNNVTNLEGKTYHVRSGWSVAAGYGSFGIQGNLTYSIAGNTYSRAINKIRLGYTVITPLVVDPLPVLNYAKLENYLVFNYGTGSYGNLDPQLEFTLEITGGSDVTNADLIAWLDINGDLIGGGSTTTVDKITEIDTCYGGEAHFVVSDNAGISWGEIFRFTDADHNEIAKGNIAQRIPIVAGENVNFEVDQENQVVKINATGGGSSSNENAMLSVTVATDYPTTMSAIIDAIEAVGGNISKLTFVTLVGYASGNIAISFANRGAPNYEVDCIDLDNLQKIYNPKTYNNIDVTTTRIGAFLDDGRPKEEMPQIRFVSMPCKGYLGWVDWSQITDYQDDSHENLKFTIEIVRGTLQPGDAIQLCRMSQYSGSTSYAHDGTKKYHPPKRKLRRLFEYTITEEDLEKRFITFEVPWNDKKAIKLFTKWTTSGVNDKTIYFRIRRPKGEINSGSNGGGMTVDAEFSNVVSVRCLSYGFEWYPHGEEEESAKFYQIRIT